MKVFVINFDEAVIYRTDINSQFYDEQFETFDEAKEQLINYWYNYLSKAKCQLAEVKQMKKSDVQNLP